MALTDAQRDEILSLHDKGLARNEIARQTGVSAGSVTNVCAANDRTFDRSSTKDAQAARSVDLADARLTLAHRLNTAANDMLDMIDKPFTVFNFGGKDNTFAEATLDSAPVEARRTIVTSAAIVFDKLTKVLEKDTSGVITANSLVDALIAGFEAQDVTDVE
ncbi:hypothetical protein [Cryobacterium arcticum]|uniref:Helix-turn-helix domain containing protein n=1 Tax=Cryobacterium arcticum TaxID=670052 RepID=A0A1B1BPS1_9MICO|nr:hypothetical protein [Cryobacterium arcticum]ANP74525.1 hypothetical protein PA27867_3606 [Cryobacterium arcticum]